MATFTQMARLLRPVIVEAAQSLPDEVAATVPELFDRYEKYIGKEIKAGTKIRENGVIYKAEQDMTVEAAPSAGGSYTAVVETTSAVVVVPDKPEIANHEIADYPNYIGAVKYEGADDGSKEYAVFASGDVHAFIIGRDNANGSATAKIVIYTPLGEGVTRFEAVRHFADRDAAVSQFYRSHDKKYLVSSFTTKNAALYQLHGMKVYFKDYVDDGAWLEYAAADGLFDTDYEGGTT